MWRAGSTSHRHSLETAASEPDVGRNFIIYKIFTKYLNKVQAIMETPILEVDDKDA